MTSRRFRPALIALAALCAFSVAAVPSLAAVLPVVGGYYIQTNGPAAAIGLGDYYSATSGGAQDHRLAIEIPCSWPSGKPVYVDLNGAEMTSYGPIQGKSEEPSGALDSSRYTLVGPGGQTTTQVFRPTAVAETWTRLATIADGRADCGTWLLTDSLLTSDPLNPGTGGDDQNGWRLRVGGDNDGDPTNAPPADADDPDGIPGTDDEIALGLERTTFQHDAGATICQTFWSFVSPGQPSATFNNFDMDGNGRVRYYAPGTAIDATGTTGGIAGSVSGNARWNASSGTTRVGDTITNPAPGWWALVSCISNHNQLIQEGVNSGLLFMKQPPTPSLTLAKDDGVTRVEAGGSTTYALTVRNTSDTSPAPGAARNVLVTDELPPNTSFASCTIEAPATGSCTETAGTVTATLDGALHAGATAVVRIRIDIDRSAPTGTLTNSATVGYTDSYGNRFPSVSDSDVDDVVRPADLTVSNALESTAYAGQPNAMSVTVENLGVETADDVRVTGDLPTGFTVTAYDTPAGWTCNDDGVTFDCATPNDLASGDSTSFRVLGTIEAAPDDDLAFPVAVSTTTVETNLTNNDDTLAVTVVAFPADVTVVTAIEDSFETGSTNSLKVTVGSEGLDDAAGVKVGGAIPTGFDVTGFDAPAQWLCDSTATQWECTRAGELATGSSEVLRVLGEVTADGGQTVTFVTDVSTTTLEFDFSDNQHTVDAVAKALSVTVAAVCERDVPWMNLDVTALGFTATPDQSATVVWKTLGGTVVQTDTNVPLVDAKLLWPGASIDAEGNGTGWPGWELVAGTWVEVPDQRDGTLIVDVSVNPSTTASLTYPEATAACAAAPPVTQASRSNDSGGGTGADTADPSVAGESAGSLPNTGGDAAGALSAGLTLLLLGMAVRLASRRSRASA